ncbi:unnamed protein product [Cuscuta epithymum]|uniref:DUF641 domain-containing protein n=1 Tax=Cuscuta epithymum TaxID=186058 RepID=A0AAV0FI05_9ASTE|nr:unnamed protein product [Cuscuta epithymum]
MANMVSNMSDLIQRITAPCLLHPPVTAADRDNGDSDEDKYNNSNSGAEITHSEDDEEGEDSEIPESSKEDLRAERVLEMEMILAEVFEAVVNMKKAYVSLQEAHIPWDPDKMRVADVAVVAELRRLGILKERYRRSVGADGGGRGRRIVGAATLREVVAPYEAVADDLRREMKCKEAEIENLKEKLKTTASLTHCNGKKLKSKQNVSCSTQVKGTKLSGTFFGTNQIIHFFSKEVKLNYCIPNSSH